MFAVLILLVIPTLAIGADTGPIIRGLALLAVAIKPSPSVLANTAAVNRRFFIKISLYLRTSVLFWSQLFHLKIRLEI